MERSGEQMGQKKGESEEQKKGSGGGEKEKVEVEGIPLESSPYVNYKNVEDYKRQGYGTEGHHEVKPGRGGGATDAPTPSGGALSAKVQDPAVDAINCRGVP